MPGAAAGAEEAEQAGVMPSAAGLPLGRAAKERGAKRQLPESDDDEDSSDDEEDNTAALEACSELQLSHMAEVLSATDIDPPCVYIRGGCENLSRNKGPSKLNEHTGSDGVQTHR